jgi:hypothetical protein
MKRCPTWHQTYTDETLAAPYGRGNFHSSRCANSRADPSRNSGVSDDYRSTGNRTLSKFAGVDERLDHLRLLEVAAKLVQLAKPELVATLVRVATQIAEVFHHHERFVGFRFDKALVFSDSLQHARCVKAFRASSHSPAYHVRSA